MILIKFPFGPLATNTILIGCTKTKIGAVIDSASQSTAAVCAKAIENGLKIEKILLTHSHWDHIADLKALATKTQAPVYVHPLDAKNVKLPGSDGLPLYIPIEPVDPSAFLNDGDVIQIGTLHLEVIHTPGHSPGSVCFYLEKEKLLIAGDTLFKGGCGRMDLPTGNPLQMRDSLSKLARLPPETRVISGHGEDTTIGQERGLL